MVDVWNLIQTGFCLTLGGLIALIIGYFIITVIQRLISYPEPDVQVVNMGEVSKDDLFTEDFDKRLKEAIEQFGKENKK